MGKCGYLYHKESNQVCFLFFYVFFTKKCITNVFLSLTHFRFVDTRLLQLTEKSYISSEGKGCDDGENYNPDSAIMELITKEINCSLPWSNHKFEGIKECKTEDDFRGYLKTICNQQRQIKQVPKKCRHKKWEPSQYEKSTESGESKVTVDLLLVDSKVGKC